MSDTETRPKPGPRNEDERTEHAPEEKPQGPGAEQQGSAAEQGSADDEERKATDPSEVVEAVAKAGYGDSSDGQDYLDRDKMPYDPAEGLYSGTAVTGTSEIAGPHQHQDDIGDTSEDSQAEAAKLAAERPEAAQGASTPEGNVGKQEGND